MPSVKPARLLTLKENVKISSPGRPPITALTPKDQPTETTKDGARTLRVRTLGHRPLPLPPIMDPKAIDARTQYEQTKAPRPKEREKSAFQRELWLNPYARALVTPVRQCVISHARLPEHLLQPFKLRLDSLEEGPKKGSAHFEPQLDRQESRNATSSTESAVQDMPLSSTTTFVLSNKSLLSSLGGKKKKWIPLASERMREWYATMNKVQSNSVRPKDVWTWSDDIPKSVLSSQRGEVARLITETMLDSKITPTATRSEMEALSSAACFLKSAPETETSSALPVYDLSLLLGENYGSRFGLVDIDPAGVMAVEDDKSTLKLRLALLKLATFLNPLHST